MITKTDAFPLKWPDGWPRAGKRITSRFSTGFSTARNEAVKQLRLLGAKSVVISSNAPLKPDGMPYATFPQLADPGMAVYFFYQDQQMVVACDKYNKASCNLWAIAKTLDSLRSIARWGATEMMAKAFNGFAQLPPPSAEGLHQAKVFIETRWWNILEVPQDARPEEIRSAWKRKAKENHPDIGGSLNKMSEINAAYREAQHARGF